MTEFIVHKSDGTSHVSMPSNKGLFLYSDVKGNLMHIHMNTVDKNKIYTQSMSTQLSIKPVHFKTLLGTLVLKILLNMYAAELPHHQG